MTSETVYSTSTANDKYGAIIYIARSMPELELELETPDYGPARYNYQCFYEHVGSVEPESELEQRCIQREASGYLDALILSGDECPMCHEAERQRKEYYYTTYGYDPYEDLLDPLPPESEE